MEGREGGGRDEGRFLDIIKLGGDRSSTLEMEKSLNWELVRNQEL